MSSLSAPEHVLGGEDVLERVPKDALVLGGEDLGGKGATFFFEEGFRYTRDFIRRN